MFLLYKFSISVVSISELIEELIKASKYAVEYNSDLYFSTNLSSELRS